MNSSLRGVIERNVYVQNGVMNVVRYRPNRKVKSIIDGLSEIDPILDFRRFCKAVTEIKANYLGPGKTFGLSGIATESLLYGHLRSLMEYANFDYDPSRRLLLPNIEHGIGWLQRVPANVKQPYVHCAVSQGSYRSKAIRGARPWLPHYTVGPYIHYARPCYDKQQMDSMKRDWGRTLLVFPAHTYELSDVSFGKERFVESVMSTYGSQFDTVVVSAYWHDADDSLFDLFEEAGAIVASSGMREDSRFISRLKALIMLSDAVVGNALGTHIGYCMCLNRPFAFLESSDAKINDVGNAFKTEEERQLDIIQHQFEDAFSCFADMKDKQEDQKRLYETYWGGDSAIKSPEEIRCMINISEDVLKCSRGSTSKFQQAVYALKDESERGNSDEDGMRFRLLSDALGCD